MWTISQEQLSITSTSAIQIFLASKQKSRNTCQADVLHFLFAELFTFHRTVLLPKSSDKRNMHTLSLFTYNFQEITNNLKIHRLDKINKPVKFLMGQWIIHKQKRWHWYKLFIGNYLLNCTAVKFLLSFRKKPLCIHCCLHPN